MLIILFDQSSGSAGRPLAFPSALFEQQFAFAFKMDLAVCLPAALPSPSCRFSSRTPLLFACGVFFFSLISPFSCPRSWCLPAVAPQRLEKKKKDEGLHHLTQKSACVERGLVKRRGNRFGGIYSGGGPWLCFLLAKGGVSGEFSGQPRPVFAPFPRGMRGGERRARCRPWRRGSDEAAP